MHIIIGNIFGGLSSIMLAVSPHAKSKKSKKQVDES